MYLQTMKNNSKEFFAFAFAAILILGFSSLPYLSGKVSETDAYVFRGIYADTTDYSVHLSMMQAGRLGDWAYQMRFTTEEHQPAFIRLFYILLGHISKLLRLSVETTFQLARWFFGFTALLAIKNLFHKIFSDKTLLWFSFLLAVFGSGLGWLQLFLGAPLKPISPIDFWLIDAYVLFSISLFPAFAFTLTLMAWSLNLFFNFLERGKWSDIALIGGLAALCQLFNPIAFAPIDIAFTGATFFIWIENKKLEYKALLALIVIGLVQIPLLIYNYSILSHNPFWSQFTIQNETLSPPLKFYFFGFAPFWLFAPLGLFQALKERNIKMLTLCFWAIASLLLAYAPVSIQRRFLLGITIPLGALSIYGFNFLINRIAPKFLTLASRKGLFFFTYTLLASISSLFLILNASLSMPRHPEKLFYSRDIKLAASWLSENSTPNEFILTNIETSQILAQETALKVYVGHEMETLFFHNKEKYMQEYFLGELSSEWLAQTPIKWVFYGPYESKITKKIRPNAELRLVYENKSVKIYVVDK